MLLCQLFIQKDAAYNCVGRLGHLSTVQFRDVSSCCLFYLCVKTGYEYAYFL